jgi:hypothetical protein
VKGLEWSAESEVVRASRREFKVGDFIAVGQCIWVRNMCRGTVTLPIVCGQLLLDLKLESRDLFFEIQPSLVRDLVSAECVTSRGQGETATGN